MRNVCGWSVAAVLVVASIGFAQVRDEDRPADAPRRAGDAREDAATPDRGRPGTPAARTTTLRPGLPGEAAGASSSLDQQIAALIHGACSNEIAIAKFAQDKAQSEQVKQFAEKMVKEHSAGCEKVKQLAGNLVSHEGHGDVPDAAPRATRTRRPGALDAPDADDSPRRPGADAPRATPRDEGEGEDDEPRADDRPRAATRPGADVRIGGAARPGVEVDVRAGGSAGDSQWVSIHKEIGEKCLKSTQQELSRHEGRDFDQGFMGQQLMAHMEMVDKLSVLKNHASPELQQVIDSELQMAQKHLQEARQIMEQMKDSEAPERTARRPGSEEKSDSPRPAPRRTTPRPENRPE